MTVISIQLDHLRTRLALINHKRKKSLLTVKESLGDSGRSSKSSSRREDSLSQSMNRGPKLSLAPHRILPRTDLRCKMQLISVFL